MLMERAGHSGFTSIAAQVTVDIGVSRKLTLLAAKTAVPMAIFSSFPASAKLMLVEVRRDRSFANIAELVAIRIFVGHHIVPLAAKAAVPMVRTVEIPFDGK